MRGHGDEFRPDYPMPVEYTGIHRERRRASGWQLYSALGIKKGDRESSAAQSFRNFELFGAPHVAIISVAAEQHTYGVLDAGIYVGTLLLAAQALGLAAAPQAALARVAPFLRDYFDVDESQKVLLAVSFGYPDLNDPANSYRTERAPLDEVVRFVDR
jgi:nitroreductase